MNYTVTVRNYLSEHKNEYFDISKELSESFKMVPSKTMMKIMSRMADEGLAYKVAKGLYFIGDKENYSIEHLIKYCSHRDRGTKIGYALYNELKITDKVDDEIVIVTNVIGGNERNIGNVHLISFNSFSMFPEKIDLIRILDIIEKGYNNIVGAIPEIEVIQMMMRMASGYMDWIFESIVKRIKYRDSTIQRFADLLNALSIQNDCINIYRKHKNE